MTNGQTPRRLIIGISGASGVVYGVRMLEILAETDVETHLVMSKSAEMTIGYELDIKPSQVAALAHTKYQIADVGAAISSGSFKTLGMVVVPCSIRSMSEIAYGNTTSLLTRAADVVLKERRRLVCMVRETPLHTGHLRAMTHLSESGGIIMPPVPAMYSRPETIDDIVTQSVCRALDLFGIEIDRTKRWGEDLKDGRRKSNDDRES